MRLPGLAHTVFVGSPHAQLEHVKRRGGETTMDLYALLFGSLVAGGLSPRDVVLEQLPWTATGLIIVGAVCLVIVARPRFKNMTEARAYVMQSRRLLPIQLDRAS